MSTIVKDQPHQIDQLALFTQVDGVLADAYLVRFQVWDAGAGLPGTQKLPSAGGWVTATASPYKVRTGTYAVIDPATSAAWIPAAAMTRVHVLWEVTQAEGDSPSYVSSFHEVVLSSVTPIGKPSMALVQDVKDYGLGSTYTDRQIFESLQLAMAVVERYCRLRFRLVRERKSLSGTGARVLFLAEPLFGLESVTTNEASAALANASVRVEGATGPDRHNPQIGFAGARSRDIFAGTSSAGVFDNRLAQVIVGAWGFVEAETQQAPQLVRDALVRLAYLQLARSVASGGSSSALAPAGPVRSEMTDGHMISYAAGTAGTRTASLALLQQDTQVRDALDLYRSPMGLGAPANEW